MDKIKVKAIIGVEMPAPTVEAGTTTERNAQLRDHAEQTIKNTLSDMNPEILRLNLSSRETNNGD
jgi:hypothetical protein